MVPPVLARVFAEVAIPVPLRKTFSYLVPEALVSELRPGHRVAVPFGGRKTAAIVVALDASAPPTAAKSILSILDDAPVFSTELLRFIREAAEYYCCPLGEALRTASPAVSIESVRGLREQGLLEEDEGLGRTIATRKKLYARIPMAKAEPVLGRKLGPAQAAVLAALEAARTQGDGALSADELQEVAKTSRGVLRVLAERGLVELEERVISTNPFFSRAVGTAAPPVLNAEQTSAVEAITLAAQLAHDSGSRTDQSRAFLLQGITGSGKTEVYLRVIAKAREHRRGAIVLVPEIALTPQLVSRFRERFGDDIAVLHSGLTNREREQFWRDVWSGRVRLVIGARSAIFAPVHDLGIVVVDEEHDPSFKQEDGFRYNARDLALLRAQRAHATAVLGSATPSIETRTLVAKGRMVRLVLSERATSMPLPRVEIVDLRRQRRGPTGHPLFSGSLHRALGDCLHAAQQAILFLNRRGFAPSIHCESCGYVVGCPSCSVALTEHRSASRWKCHYCDYETATRLDCPMCGSAELKTVGMGTEQLVEIIHKAYPDARVTRLDRDTGAGAKSERVLDAFRNREFDVLVGTQMVTKGHDLPNVTLVGVMLADHSLAFPDFRAAERTFQLLAQVAGRAGRGTDAGRVIFQTFQPEHPAVQLAARHDYEAFYEAELRARRELAYPPFTRLAAVRIDAESENAGEHFIDKLTRVARHHPHVRSRRVEVVGPAPAPIAKLRTRFRFRFFLRAADRKELRAVVQSVLLAIDEPHAGTRAHVDIDPISML